MKIKTGKTALLFLLIAVTSFAYNKKDAIGDKSTFSLLFSISAYRSSPAAFKGQPIWGSIYVFISPDAGVGKVDFSLDGNIAAVNPLDTRTLTDGSHTIVAAITKNDGSAATVSGTLTVSNKAALLFKSGFENGVTISASHRTSDRTILWDLLGSDVSGFSWPAKIWEWNMREKQSQWRTECPLFLQIGPEPPSIHQELSIVKERLTPGLIMNILLFLRNRI